VHHNKCKRRTNSDLLSIIRGELSIIKNQLNTAGNRPVNRITKYYFKDCVARINDILNPKKKSVS
tara:strand:+ start:1449 stop:1643 length:195 start_codon:yes stop_codon:yes gene_type:complete